VEKIWSGVHELESDKHTHTHCRWDRDCALWHCGCVLDHRTIIH